MADVIANGMTNGSIYAIVALGFVLVYRNSGVMNFAHPEIGMLGGFLFFSLWVEQSWPYLLAAGCGVALSAAVALAARQLLAPQERDPLSMLLGTLGVAGVIVWVASEIWGTVPVFVPPFGGGVDIEVVGMRYRGPALMIIGALVVLTAAIYLFYRYSRLGLALRASAVDRGAAELMGVNVGQLSAITWVIAGALSGTAAVLVAPLVNFDPFFMTLLFLRALAAALLAGMRSLGGTVLGGLGIGLAEAFLIRESSTPGLPELGLVLIIVALLLVRPRALGRQTA